MSGTRGPWTCPPCHAADNRAADNEGPENGGEKMKDNSRR